MEQLTNGWRAIDRVLPNVISGLLLILVAWLVATLVKKAFVKGLQAINFDKRLKKWGAVQSSERASSMITTIGQVLYYLVWVLFLPGIFETFNLMSVAVPIQNMIDTVLSFLPRLISAGLLVAAALIAGKFVKNLMYNLALTLDIDGWISKITGQTSNEAVEETVHSANKLKKQKDTMASVLSNIAYALISIPIFTVALEVLGIRSISEPIVGVFNNILAAIPNILVAVILLVIGIAIAKFVGNLIKNLLQGAGINKATEKMGLPPTNFNLAKTSGQIVAGLINLFFFVEAISALNLEVLNTIGTAIIAYVPNILSALVILGLGFIGGQWLRNIVSQSTGSKWTGRVLQYIILAFALFMILDQLMLASTIVNTAFMFIIGGLAVAFALAFGLGGRDFARTQLEKLDTKVEKEANKNGKNNY